MNLAPSLYSRYTFNKVGGDMIERNGSVRINKNKGEGAG